MLVAFLGCNQKNTPGPSNAKTLHYDTAVIAIFKWDVSKYYSFPKNSDPILLTQDEIVLIDRMFAAAVTSYNGRKRPLLPKWYRSFGMKDS